MFFYILFNYLVFRIDAQNDSGLAKYINDNNKRPNLRPKMVILNGLPVPVFFTLTLIEAGTKLEYNYGGGKYAWRMKG